MKEHKHAGQGSQMVPVIAFVAFSGVGKTTLIEKVIVKLKGKGFKIAVLKHDRHGIVIDPRGKDSRRFTEAGADISMLVGPTSMAYFEQGSFSLQEALEKMPNVDLILVEGYKNEPLSQIGLCRQSSGKDFTADTDRFVAIVTDRKDIRSKRPVFDLDDVDQLVEFIIQNKDTFTSIKAGGCVIMEDMDDYFEKDVDKKGVT